MVVLELLHHAGDDVALAVGEEVPELDGATDLSGLLTQGFVLCTPTHGAGGGSESEAGRHGDQ